jgi:hypothetical protein
MFFAKIGGFSRLWCFCASCWRKNTTKKKLYPIPEFGKGPGDGAAFASGNAIL